jgi:hypothetical protein
MVVHTVISAREAETGDRESEASLGYSYKRSTKKP